MGDYAGFELSVQMERLWLLEPGGPSRKSQVAVELDADADPARICAELELAIARHEVLRTRFERPAGLRVPLQVIEDAGGLSWDVAEVSGASDLNGLLAREERQTVDLQAGGQPFTALRAVFVTMPPARRLLVLTAPASIADARSLALLAEEVVAAAPGGPDPLQYADYAAWQRERLTPKLASAATTPAGLPMAEPLPADGHEATPATVSVPLEEADWTRLASAAEAAGARLADGMLAAWAVALARATGEPELSVGVETDGRVAEELERAIGPFARSISLELAVPEEISLDEAVRRAAAAQNDLQDQGDRPAAPGDVVTPFAFSYQELPRDVVAQHGHPDAFQVKLACTAGGGGISAQIFYDPRAIAHERADLLAHQLARFVAAAAHAPDRATGRVPIVTPAEYWLLDELNATDEELPDVRGVHELFERSAHATPGSTAVVAGDVSATYAELDAHANRIAHLLREQGVRPGERVAILLDRSIELIAAVLGTLKAGAAYVPLHPDHPAARLAFQLEEAAPTVLLTRSSMRSAAPRSDIPVIAVDADDPDVAAAPADAAPPAAASSDTAYVIYTSGSSGLPKGVAVTHRNLLNYTTAIGDLLGVGAEPLHFGLVTTMSTDLGNTSVFPALTSGGCLHLVPVDAAMDPGSFAAYTRAHPLDVLKITPSHLGALLSGGDAGVLPRRTLVLGGEALPWDLVDEVRRLAACEVLNHYGPTETTVGSLVYPVNGDMPAGKPRTVPIGRPLANTQVYIVGVEGELVPVGAPGELCIGGAGVASGYWARPDETAARFVELPFADGPVYRTGDRARHLPDGSVEFLGRADGQVKIRGFRVETAEIESVLKRDPAVREAVVVMREERGQQRLVAYVVGPQLNRAGTAALRALAEDQLPDYMIPASFMVLDALPLAPNGKLDRSALPAPETAADERSYTPPRNETEKLLAELWAETLGLERVGVDDDFFEVGGHSLLATQVIARSRSAFGIDLPLHALFTSPTVGQLAATIDAERQDPAGNKEQLARMLEEIESMSDEEARRLLSQSDSGS